MCDFAHSDASLTNPNARARDLSATSGEPRREFT